MPTDNKQNPALPDLEREDRNLEALGKSAATAVAGIGLMERVAEVAVREEGQVSDEAAGEERRNDLLGAGERVIAAEALKAGVETEAGVKSQANAIEKANYERMAKLSEEEAQRQAQRRRVTVSAPAPTSVVAKVAKSGLGPWYQYFLPGSGFLTNAFKKILS